MKKLPSRRSAIAGSCVRARRSQALVTRRALSFSALAQRSISAPPMARPPN
jgi:hypothetical protein